LKKPSKVERVTGRKVECKASEQEQLLQMKDIQARENNTTEKIRQAANMGLCLWTCRWTCRESRSKAIDSDQNWGFDIILAGEQTEERDELADGEAAFSSIPCIANKLAAITI
jgi:hypothetical protein